MTILGKAQPTVQEQDLLAAAFDSLADGVLVFGEGDCLALWNRRWQELLPEFAEGLQRGQSFDEVVVRLDNFDGGRFVRQWRRGTGNLLVMTVRPIDEPIRRERELRQGEQRLRDVVEAFADWIWECNAQGEITFVSEVLGPTTSVRSPQINSARQLMGEPGEWMRQVPAAQRHEPFRAVRVRVQQDDGCLFLSLSGKPLFDLEGRFLGYRGAGFDVSPRVRNDEERERSRARLLDAIEHLSHGLAVFDPEDRLVLCNERFRKSMPVGQAAVPGISFAELVRLAEERATVAPEDLEMAVEEQIECHRLGLTHERHSPDGRWFLIKDVRLKDGATVTTRTDITELKRREQAVRDSEARFRAVFQHAAIGIAVVQPGGHIIQANQALANMLGYAPDELERMRYAELLNDEHMETEVKLARRLLNGEIDYYQQEARYLHRQGRSVWGRLTASVVRHDGVASFAIVMIEDIEERKRAEAGLSTFRAVVEASAEAIAILSPDGQPFYINSAHAKLFGRELAEAARVGYRRHYSETSQLVVQREVVPALLRGDNWEGVLEARAADGRVFPLWQRAGVVRDAANRPKFYFAFMHDHTSQQQVQDELYRAKETAEQANTAKTRFLAAASHDLRQPLQALSMFVAVLSNRNHSAEDVALIKRIEDSVNAVEGLLNGLLDVSKLEAGLVVPCLGTFSVGPIMERLASEFEPLVAEAQLELRLVGSHAMVKSDPALLERILRNLLNNAVRYTRKGRILFGCRRQDGCLRIEVWDTGIGIPTSQIKLIFREFHQLGNPGRDRRQGLGLGLAIVERPAQLLKHRVTVASQPDKGSVFSVAVPLASHPETIAQPRQLTLGIGRSNLAVVVVEDEPDVLESTKLLLESWGHRVYAALDCDAALGLLGHIGKPPDLILADYRLQNGATGGQAISRIRSRLKRAVPAIILTGDTAPERLRQAQASGHGLLHKPVQPAALRQMINELLARVPLSQQVAGE